MNKLTIIILSLLGPLLFAVPAYAAVTTNAPTLTVHSAWAVQDVSVAGDLVVMWRYTLPEATWATATADGAVATLDETSVHQTKVPPTLGSALGGFYLSPGHSFTWGAAATVELFSNPSLFTNNTSSSESIQYLSTIGLVATSTADQAALCTTITGLLLAVEAADTTDSINTNDYVSGSGTPTIAGTEVALTAFSAFTDVLPGCFFVGVEGAGVFTAGDPDLRDSRNLTVQATDQWARFDAMAAQYGFDDAEIAAALLGLAVAGLSLVLFTLTTGSMLYAGTVAGLVLLFGGMNAPGYLLQGAFVLAALSAVGAGAFWSRHSP